MRPSVCYPARHRHYTNDLPSFLNAFFDNLSNTTQHSNGHVNIAETATTYEVEVALPGMNKEDFKVKIETDMLTVSAEKTTEQNAENSNNTTGNDRKYIRREFNYTSFKRSFTLPENVDAAGIKAQYNNGILVVTLPKKNKPTPEAKTIEIN